MVADDAAEPESGRHVGEGVVGGAHAQSVDGGESGGVLHGGTELVVKVVRRWRRF